MREEEGDTKESLPSLSLFSVPLLSFLGPCIESTARVAIRWSQQLVIIQSVLRCFAFAAPPSDDPFIHSQDLIVLFLPSSSFQQNNSKHPFDSSTIARYYYNHHPGEDPRILLGHQSISGDLWTGDTLTSTDRVSDRRKSFSSPTHFT